MSVITKTIAIVLLIAALGFVSFNFMFAQNPKEEGHGKPAMHNEKGPGHDPMIPDLTDEQKEQIKDLRIELMQNLTDLHNKLGEKQARLRTLQTAAKANMSEINNEIEAVGKLHTEIMKLKAANHQKIRSLLTDEQRVFFDAHHPPHDKHGPGEHHGHPGHGPR